MENYTIYDEIGRGTMSFVYKARRKRSIEYVAVKSTDKARMAKILNEVQILHRLDSRHVLKFYNWYESVNHIWLIFEYCIGGDLLNLITQDRRLPEAAVRAFGWELVGGLQYLHANSIIYCDLKPANILIDECGSLKLADFGLARRIPTSESILATPLAPGSPHYMAPELFQPPAIHSFASDLWSLGCVLYELCTGRQPFTHTSFPELARIIQNVPLVNPEAELGLSSRFIDLLHRLLEKDPHRRITWPELLEHPFWTGCAPLDVLELPVQELFDASHADRHQELEAESLSIAIPNPQDAPYQQRLGGEPPTTESPSGPSQSDGEKSLGKDLDDETLNQSESDDLDEEDHDEQKQDEHEGAIQQIRPMTAPSLLHGAAVPQHGKRKDPELLRERSGENGTQNGHSNGRATKTAPAAGSRKRLPLEQPTSARRTVLTKVAKLLFVTADSSVKPIAFSDDIEQNATPVVDPDLLDFEPMSAEQLLACTTEDVEDHLRSIYISLKSTESSASEKKNVLAHLFSLCLHPRLANVIVNSSLLTLLIKMLHRGSPTARVPSGQTPHDRISIGSSITLVLGVLFRFATFISSTSPDHIHALVVRLIEIVRTRSSQGKATDKDSLELTATRCTTACLGELLFYLASQKDSRVPAAGSTFLQKAVDDSDSVTRHYATRTVANILAQTTDSNVQCLVSEHVVHALLRSLLKSREPRRHDSVLLQTSTTQALAQVFRHIRLSSLRTPTFTGTKVAAMVALSKTSVLSVLWHGVASGKTCPDLAVASLNVLNTFLEMSVDQDQDADAHAAVARHKHVLLTQIASTSAVGSLLEARSKFEEDEDTRYATHTGLGQGATHASGRRRYAEDGHVLPSLLRAKTILFVYFAVQRSSEFARVFVREQLLDKIELLLTPYSAVIHAKDFSPSKPASRKQDSGFATSSPRGLPAFDQYLVQCGLNMVRLSIRTALKMGAECISSSHRIDYQDEERDDGSSRASVASEPFQLIEQLVKNPVCRAQLCDYFLVNGGKEFQFFVRLMSKLLTSFAMEVLPAMRATVGAVISRLLLKFFRCSLSDAAALVAAESEEMFTHLLPAIVVQLQRVHHAAHGHGGETHEEEVDDDDHSVNCIQLVYLVMIHLQLDLPETEMVGERDMFVKKHLLPCFQELFSFSRQNENVWRISIELLQGLVAQDPELVSQFDSSGLVGPILALLSSPKQHQYSSLPASATALVRTIVETSKQTNTIHALHGHQIAQHVAEGLEFVVDLRVFTVATVDLLDALYLLLYNRYDERRKATDSNAPPDFDQLVWTGPLLVHLCAHADATNGDSQPQDSPNKTPAATTSVHQEILDGASRCLVYLSQLFGAQLNEVLFDKPQSPTDKDQVPGDFVKCLSLSAHEAVLLRVLLTIKNSLRCDKKSGTLFTRQWLLSDHNATSEIIKISKWEHAPSSQSVETNPCRHQAIKAASEILSFFQTTAPVR